MPKLARNLPRTFFFLSSTSLNKLSVVCLLPFDTASQKVENVGCMCCGMHASNSVQAEEQNLLRHDTPTESWKTPTWVQKGIYLLFFR